MKYISLVILLVLMIWTWSLATTSRAATLQQHSAIEEGVIQDVAAFIQRKYPDTTEIYCPQLYTELTDHADQVIAHFRCQANGALTEGELTEQVFTGRLILKSNDGFKTWSELGGEIRSPEVRFLHGTEIGPEKK